jgi:hypothetical protein
MSKQELKDIEIAAFERSIDYKPVDETLSPQKYYERGFIDGATWNTSPDPECEWVSVEDRLPDKPNKAEYEYVDCWIFYKGQIMRTPWNCEERCWDDADYDDHFCKAKAPTHWMFAPLPAPPETEEAW